MSLQTASHQADNNQSRPDNHRHDRHAGHGHTDRDHHEGGHYHGLGAHTHGASENRILIATIITFGFMIAEVIGGIISGSLTLLADAAHMVTDAIALGFAWFAFRVARRPSDDRRTYGFHRLQIIVALVNGVALVAIALMITLEAIARFQDPTEVLGGTMLVIGILGLLVNIVSFFILQGADQANLNVKGATLHVLGDILGSVAALVAALVIIFTGWPTIDPILSIFVSVIILRSAWKLVREAGHILMEGTPDWINIEAIRADLRDHVPEVRSIHHVHAWMITPERPMITLHAQVDTATDINRTTKTIRQRLKTQFNLDHATIELEKPELESS